MADALELIRNAKLPERSVPICLRGDLVAEHELLDSQLVAALRQKVTSLAGNPEAEELASRVRALEARMADETVTFTVRALPRREWAAMVAKHPPRKDDGGRVVDSDAMGVNVDDFVSAVLRKCVAEPVLGDDDWGHLVDECLSDAQYNRLADAMWQVNRREIDVPFSRAASTILRASEPA